MSIQINNVCKRFGEFVALDNVSLEVPNGELTALLGPSGSGKTTLLRIIAGLEVPDSGTVLYHGADVTNQPVRDRNIGFVFQHFALFRHMNVYDNIAFGMRVRGAGNDKIKERVRELIQLVRLEGLKWRFPSQLSGGQRQRVALARAMAAEPKVLLLDEPFGALDAKVRQELRQWLRRLHDEVHLTSVFVTHDQEEAFEVADLVVVMNHGRVEQAGTPHDVFENPASAFVMDFLGNVNVFHGRVQNGRAILGSLAVECPEYPHQEDRPATLYVRPHELDIEHSPNGTASLRARVERLNPAGSVAKVLLRSLDFGVEVNVDMSPDRYGELALRMGDTVYVSPRKVRVFVPEYVI